MCSYAFTASKQREFAFELVVTQGDITPYGSASFINYVRWCGIARDALLQWPNLGFDNSLKGGVEIEVPFCNIQYKREAMLQDEIIVKINSSNIRQAEFTLLFTIIRRDDALLICLGKQKIMLRNSKTSEILTPPKLFTNNILKPIELNESSLLFKY